jgi:hypothetical protein
MREQARALEGPLQVGLVHVVLVEQDDHLAGVEIEEAPDRGEEGDHVRRPELAERVAQPDVPLTAQGTQAQRASQAPQRLPGLGSELVRDPVLTSAVGPDVRPHMPCGVGDAVVG